MFQLLKKENRRYFKLQILLQFLIKVFWAFFKGVHHISSVPTVPACIFTYSLVGGKPGKSTSIFFDFRKETEK